MFVFNLQNNTWGAEKSLARPDWKTIEMSPFLAGAEVIAETWLDG